MSKDPQEFEFVECPHCDGTGIEDGHWTIFDEEGEEIKTVTDIDDVPQADRSDAECSTCEGHKQVEIDDFYEWTERPFIDSYNDL